MTTFLILKLFHLLGFVYWLGGDLGTYFSSRFVVDPTLSPAQRATALKIMIGCDQGPKLAMPMMLALGYSLATQLTMPAVVSVAVWAVCLGWFANVNYLYFTKNAAAKAAVGRADLWFRCIMVVSLLAAAAFIGIGWLAAKVAIFALLVAAGIYIRIQLKPFVPAFGELMTKGSSPQVEATLSGSIARCRPAVYFIWAGLVTEAALGLHLIQIP